MLGILFSWIAQNSQTIHKWPFYAQFWSFDKNKAPMIIFRCLNCLNLNQIKRYDMKCNYFQLLNTFCQDLARTKLLQLKLIHKFANSILLKKNLEIKKTKTTFIISVLKVEYKWPQFFRFFNFFINKIALANKWMRKIISSFLQ